MEIHSSEVFLLKIHVELWLAAASLHEAGAAPFTPKQLRQEVLRLFNDDRPGVTQYTYAHANGSNKKAIPTVYNYIVNIGSGRCRLAQPSDPFHPTRTGLPLWPDQAEVDQAYWPLWQKWVSWQRQPQSTAEVATALRSEAPEPAHEMDSRFSSYREAMMEHLLIGELMRHLWLRQQTLEVCKPQVDGAGYDLILQAEGVLRHVQLKTSFDGAATREVSLHIELARRQSGCVIWTRFDPATLAPVEFWWFGGAPGAPLPELDSFKAERPAHRRIPQSRFTRVTAVAELIALLFGAREAAAAPADPARQLAAYVGSIAAFRLERPPAGGYDHMGATLTEALLQVGTGEAMRRAYPEANTTTAFVHLLRERAPQQLLNLSGDQPGQLLSLAHFLQDERVETEADLRRWLGNPVNRRMLQARPGVGPRAVEYLQFLIGGDANLLDRHLTQFLELAGVKAGTDEARRQVIAQAAALLEVEEAALSYSIWLCLSDQGEKKQ